MAGKIISIYQSKRFLSLVLDKNGMAFGCTSRRKALLQVSISFCFRRIYLPWCDSDVLRKKDRHSIQFSWASRLGRRLEQETSKEKGNPKEE